MVTLPKFIKRREMGRLGDSVTLAGVESQSGSFGTSMQYSFPENFSLMDLSHSSLKNLLQQYKELVTWNLFKLW